ncbi:protein TIFY 5A-like [Mercurialis annua]|uniref:protein TIFY 5A-like n=1 Tax=Mercurialis annua TaxID=3986 RepID=UPI00215E26F1|nr:protein TIFY 5A-like [Mercurialis annua]
MRRNCNLELRLFPVSDPEEEREQQHQPQQITIFYNGNVSVCDVTEIQARVILLLASQETDDKLRTSPSPTLPSPVYVPDNGLSMKRSLQRFLQKRNNRRIQTTFPYSINRRVTCPLINQ